MIEFETNDTKITPVDFHEIQWAYIELDMTFEVTDSESLSVLISKSILEHIKNSGKKFIFRVVLKGRTLLYKELNDPSNIRYLEEDLCNELGLLDLEIQTDALMRNIDLEALKREQTVLSYALMQLEHYSESEALMRRLYTLPIFPRGMTDVEKKNFVMSKLEKVEKEIVNRMVRSNYDY